MQAGLEGSENADVVGCRDGLLMGAVVSVLGNLDWYLRLCGRKECCISSL